MKERWFKENALHDFICHCGQKLVLFGDKSRRQNQIQKAQEDFKWHSIRGHQ